MGSGNPPDKPGYKVLSLGTGTDDADAKLLNYWADQGYEVVAFDNGRVILGNYTKKDS